MRQEALWLDYFGDGPRYMLLIPPCNDEYAKRCAVCFALIPEDKAGGHIRWHQRLEDR